jgi:putative transposase
LAEQALTSDELKTMRNSTIKGWAIGSERFQTQLEKLTERRVTPGKRGRPYKQTSVSKTKAG